ncbi:hypothetical protein GUJ93_ZPchr0004g38320 [Zizania palustris]|uniref:DUF1409 domain-containing protein n=1 Tax=Zizania palustris TaxID=103762 RepID=A0A8J5RZQ1_ZIZPA|nr:hypothetical protein GUJ93_ZPchr0004g38320 [Zizania palustris]
MPSTLNALLLFQSSYSLDITSLYAVFDNMVDDPIGTPLSLVIEDIATMVIVEADLPEVIAIYPSVSAIVATIVAPVDTTSGASSITTDASHQSFTQEFPFDIGQYLQDDEAANVPWPTVNLSSEVREVLSGIPHPLDNLVETLVNDLGPIRARFNDILVSLPSNIVDDLTLMAYLEFHCSRIHRAH